MEALRGIEGVTSREAERSKNFFALGLMSWLYGRPVDVTLSFIETKFASRPELVEANTRAFKAGYHYGETTEDFVVQFASGSGVSGRSSSLRSSHAVLGFLR